MGAVAAGLVGFFAFLMMRLAEPQMATLFTDLDVRDSNTIITELESRDIPYELRRDGTTILIPKDNVLRLRMQLAEDGIPTGGAVGYELFDNTDAFGTTSFVQNINQTRALEGELARTIRSLNKVVSARVHLVLPKRELFSRQAEEPTASIVLKVRGGLDGGQVRAIQHLTASAVKGLNPARVSIVDEDGRLLASGSGTDTGFGLAASFDERDVAIERRMQNQIQEIVESVVGRGRARVNVAAELDYNRITQTSDTYDPESRVVRSTQVREENSAAKNASDNKGVTVGNELPGADGAVAGGGTGSEETENKSEEVVNYEISRTTRTEVLEAGRIKRISVAVLVDGTYAEDANGALAYTPRPQEQLDQIAALVRSAVGYDQDRGDQIEVINLRFAETAALEGGETPEPGLFEFNKEDYFYIAELAVLLIVATLVLLFVVRPLVRRIVTPEEVAELAEVSGSQQAQLTGPDGTPLPTSDGGQLTLPESQTAKMIELAQMVGEEQATTIRQIGEMVDNHPSEALSIIRQWIEEAA